MTTETKAYDFKVGDQVWCILHGKGIVTAIHKWEDSGEYPVQGNYCNIEDYNYYTLDGKLSKEGPRALFFSEPKIVASVTRPLCEPSGQASCPSAFVPTLVGKTVMLHTKAWGIHNGEITIETQDALVVNYIMWNKSSIEAIYEVSSENLLK